MIITPIQPTGNFNTCAVMFACIPVQFGDVYTKAETDALLAGKQKTLIAGDNITIEPDGTINSTGGGGAIHNDLLQRDAADAHPIGSISGLQAELDSKLSTLSFEDKYADTIARWETKCLTGTPKEYGRYNSTTQLFECNDILDISLDEAVSMLDFASGIYLAIPSFYFQTKFRTTLSLCGDEFQRISFNPLGTYQSNLQSIRYTTDMIQIETNTDVGIFVYYTRDIQTIYGVITMAKSPSRTIQLDGLVSYRFIIGANDASSFDWDMSNSNTTSDYDSLFYMLNHWGGTTNPLVTQRALTLHPDLSDKIFNPANPDYATYSPLSAEATRKNILITTP